MVAVCLGRINGYEHFYTIGGKWFYGLGVKTLFVVNNFVTPAELKPVIEALPPPDVSIEDLNALQDLGEGPTRTAGSEILQKMLKFTQDAEAVYQANAGTLDATSTFVGHPVEHRYLTLHEIADRVLPESEKASGKFSAHCLYAVHRTLLQDEVFFRPLRHRGHRRSYLFEVSPLSEIRIVQTAERIVRDYQESLEAFSQTDLPVLEAFAITARKAIDKSRETREWSEHGLLGPSSEMVRAEPEWSALDLEILHFMQLWACYQKFPLYSRLQTLGSTILRVIGRYQEAQRFLPSLGWTFLQEVGWISPWDIPARYSVRFPNVEVKRGGNYYRPDADMLGAHLDEDRLAPIRKPLDGVTAYCIDDITAREIDDAVSLERTSDPEQYWVHVHVADPASSFDADSPLAKYANSIPEAIYLPGYLEPMLPESVIHSRFSLAPDRPCLTFSALVNTDGVVLDEKITANVLKSVVYMTYEDTASAIGEIRDDPYAQNTEWSLGTIPTPKPETVNRKMSQPKDLTEGQRSDLSILSKLGKTIQAKRLEKGATPFFQPRPMASVDFTGVMQEKSEYFTATQGDPSIQVHYSGRSGTDLVENAMKLANEVAARWCHGRGIPIPYRTQPHALRNAAVVQQYARDVLNPMLCSGLQPDDSIWGHMRSLVGADEVSTTPGPHFTLGSDMYTKATSPLRRYGDLIVHWQIEAALLKEEELGRKLSHGAGLQKDDLSFLPFSREDLDRMLPMVRLGEKQARTLTNSEGADQWILQALVRAWRFKEASLPETFKLTVTLKGQQRAVGRLDWFERSAILKHEFLNDVVTSMDLRVGDVLEVRIADINMHAKQIFVEALRILERAADKKKGVEAPLAGTEIRDSVIDIM